MNMVVIRDTVVCKDPEVHWKVHWCAVQRTYHDSDLVHPLPRRAIILINQWWLQSRLLSGYRLMLGKGLMGFSRASQVGTWYLY